ncbi:hypothetical protein ACI65C_007596 [Semiaphis heraclei]
MTTNNINRFENIIKYGIDKDIDKIKIWCKFQDCLVRKKNGIFKPNQYLRKSILDIGLTLKHITEAQGLNNYPTIRHPRKHAQNYKKHIYDRTFQVKINNTLSEPFPNHNGVVQGSSISVKFLFIAINELSTQAPPPTVIKLFADDSLINCKGKNINLVKTQIQLTLDKLSKWSLETGFTFSPNKIKCILFTRQRKIA